MDTGHFESLSESYQSSPFAVFLCMIHCPSILRFSPNPRVPAGVSALIDVAAANVSLEVLVTPVTGTGVGPVAVGAGRVFTTVRQGGTRKPAGINVFIN